MSTMPQMQESLTALLAWMRFENISSDMTCQEGDDVELVVNAEVPDGGYVCLTYHSGTYLHIAVELSGIYSAEEYESIIKSMGPRLTDKGLSVDWI